MNNDNRGFGRPSQGRGRSRAWKKNHNSSNNCSSQPIQKKILVLHGSRQTGELLLGRLEKLQKRLWREFRIQLVAPDGPFEHPDDANMRQWWNRHDNSYEGLELSMNVLQDLWNQQGNIVGLLGFSQGARLAHLMAIYHHRYQHQSNQPFAGLQFVILVAGYDAPLPDNWNNIIAQSAIPTKVASSLLAISSLHCWGLKDALVPPEESEKVMASYVDPMNHTHEGGHHVPMKAPNVQAYVDFIQQVIRQASNRIEWSDKVDSGAKTHAVTADSSKTQNLVPVEGKFPNEEAALAQKDEVEALTAIYPDEITMHSSTAFDEETGETAYRHPISYTIVLHPEDDNDSKYWPPHPLALHVVYPHDYPVDGGVPLLSLRHENNVMEFPSEKVSALLQVVQQTAQDEQGMPCILSCVYAAREFMDSGRIMDATLNDVRHTGSAITTANAEVDVGDQPFAGSESAEASVLPRQVSAKRIHECNMQGLAIAERLLGRAAKAVEGTSTAFVTTTTTTGEGAETSAAVPSGKGGSWMYTIGLVGKPSAGKSTFFNTATAFARQRDDNENVLGGATMAPHPFTTIDPNIGFCLVPAPAGSCPEEELDQLQTSVVTIGCSHGRDSLGRRLLPVLLKDVAGLVPGAYKGRGRGNKFLNDLTDADVLVHVVDASGTADAEGNAVGGGYDDDANNGGGNASSQPLDDLAWIRNELIEWVFTNVTCKWDTIKRKGRTKLLGMFSGYGQTNATIWDVVLAVEKFMEDHEHRDRALDHLEEWDAGDVHRLVSAFLGARFPMALALNKYDMPSSTKHVQAIQEALPLHGAHVGIPLSALSEMNFMRHHLLQSLQSLSSSVDVAKDKEKDQQERQVPLGTWQCLQSSVMLRQPVLVFPVADMTTYEPLPGLIKYATGDQSLPSPGMIACLEASGGSAPTLWNFAQNIYVASSSSDNKAIKKQQAALRDCLLMKPGSTVEDVFVALKNRGALSGEFVRAEAAGSIGEKGKLISKTATVNRNCRILKIMTTKRSPWQPTYNISKK